jgi:hypothetical protein
LQTNTPAASTTVAAAITPTDKPRSGPIARLKLDFPHKPKDKQLANTANQNQSLGYYEIPQVRHKKHNIFHRLVLHDQQSRDVILEPPKTSDVGLEEVYTGGMASFHLL